MIRVLTVFEVAHAEALRRSRPVLLPSRSGHAVVYIDSRGVPLGMHGTAASREKYNRIISEWLANGRCLPTPAAEVTILHAIDAFRNYAEAYYRHPHGTPTGEWHNFKLALRHLKRLYGRLPEADFGPLKLRALREEMIRPGKESAGWSRTYANRQRPAFATSSSGRSRTRWSRLRSTTGWRP